jgi:anti-sigma factor RsiW
MKDHDDLIALLPWYVNGTLDERDMARVSRHLETCAACAREAEATLRDARALHAEPRPELESFERGRDRNFARLVARLDRPPKRRAPSIALGIAATVLLAVGAATWWRGEPGETFRALSSPLTGSDHMVLQLMFEPGASERDVRELLRASGGTLLGVPSKKGVYRVALADGVNGEAVAARLEEHPMVVFAVVEAR